MLMIERHNELTYDLAGNRIAKNRGAGIDISYTIASGNRLTRWDWPIATGTTFAIDVVGEKKRHPTTSASHGQAHIIHAQIMYHRSSGGM